VCLPTDPMLSVGKGYKWTSGTSRALIVCSERRECRGADRVLLRMICTMPCRDPEAL
jgi:hypothetical protein